MVEGPIDMKKKEVSQYCSTLRAFKNFNTETETDHLIHVNHGICANFGTQK